jgi:hypothetical protein
MSKTREPRESSDIKTRKMFERMMKLIIFREKSNEKNSQLLIHLEMNFRI